MTQANQTETTYQKDEMSGSVISAAIEVHRHLGRNLKPSVYIDALHHELTARQIQNQKAITQNMTYKGQTIGTTQIDLLVNNLVVQVISTPEPTDHYTAQVRSILKATNHPAALILNFGHPRMLDGVKRVALKMEGK